MLKKLLRALWKILLVSTAIVAGLLLLLILYLKDEDFVTSSTSESGDYEIIVTADEPILLGPQTIYVYGREKLWIKQLFSTSGFDDGRRIRKEDVIIKWSGNKATVILKDDELGDKVYQVEFTPTKIEVH
jgi:hypothetical protein